MNGCTLRRPPTVSDAGCWKKTVASYSTVGPGKASSARPAGHGTDDGLDRNAQALRPPELASPPDRIKDWQNFQRQEGAGEQAADHRRGDPAQDLRPGALRPKEGKEARGYGRDGHDLGPEAPDGSLGVGRNDVLAAVEQSFADAAVEGLVDVDDHHHAGLHGEP